LYCPCSSSMSACPSRRNPPRRHFIVLVCWSGRADVGRCDLTGLGAELPTRSAMVSVVAKICDRHARRASRWYSRKLRTRHVPNGSSWFFEIDGEHVGQQCRLIPHDARHGFAPRDLGPVGSWCCMVIGGPPLLRWLYQHEIWARRPSLARVNLCKIVSRVLWDFSNRRGHEGGFCAVSGKFCAPCSARLESFAFGASVSRRSSDCRRAVGRSARDLVERHLVAACIVPKHQRFHHSRVQSGW